MYIIYYGNLFVFIILSYLYLFIVNHYCHHNLLFIFMYILLKLSISRWPVCSVCSATILGDYDNALR